MALDGPNVLLSVEQILYRIVKGIYYQPRQSVLDERFAANPARPGMEQR